MADYAPAAHDQEQQRVVAMEATGVGAAAAEAARAGVERVPGRAAAAVGRYAAEIRNPYTKERHWLGTFDTAEEAAVAYDLSAISISGPYRARTNFYYPAMQGATAAGDGQQQYPQVSLPVPPPPPPPSPFSEESRGTATDENYYLSAEEANDDESLTIATILQSFQYQNVPPASSGSLY